MNERLKAVWLIVILVGTTLACGLQDKVETVDEAVSLLQDIKNNGTWTYVSDGLDELNQQSQGYVATIRLREGQVNEAGGYEGPLVQDVTLQIRVDSEHNAAIDVTENNQTRTYFVDNYRDAAESPAVYRIEGGRYVCAQDDESARLFAHGPGSVFEAYAVTATGVQTLSVAKKDKNETVAGRDATRYNLESRVPDALNVLKRLDNQELQAQVDAAGVFELTGALVLDQGTLALLKFDSAYQSAGEHDRTEFSFEITQWGAVPDVSAPAASAVDVPCR
jgi:hypothetical protein